MPDFVRRLMCWGRLVACWLAASASHAAPQTELGRPNVVVFLADDAGYGDFSLTGNTNVCTPAVDSLARDGAVLSQFLVQPFCAPTRAEFLTGRWYPRTGVRGVASGEERMSADELTIAQVFHDVGYATGCFGKWHNGTQWPFHPLARGFDSFHGFTEGHWGSYFNATIQEDGRFVHSQGYLADDLATRAISFIGQAHAAGKPFFCYLPFNTPHSPMSVPDGDWNRLRDRPVTMRGPTGDSEDLSFTRAALAMVENLDHNVQRVLDALESAGAADNTIVVFFSDNGPNSARWNAGLRGGKGSTDEGGIRSVCCIRYPGRIPAGTVVDDVAGAVDLLPTLAGLADVPITPQKPLDGIDLTPLLTTGDKGRARRKGEPPRALIARRGNDVSVRTANHLLDAKSRLYDMLHDPGQRTDISADHPEIVVRLGRIADDYRRDVIGAAPPRGREAFPIGYPGALMTELTAGEAVPRGSLRRSSPHPNSSFLTDWTSARDVIEWPVEVVTPAAYDIDLWYTVAAADAGATVQVSCGTAMMTGTIRPAWNPPLKNGDDRIRRVEGYEKEFRPVRLGTITLPAGPAVLKVQATKIPGATVADVRRLVLTPAAAAGERPSWPRVPPMDWSGIGLKDFADHELEVPYYLEHFHTVANRVVEQGEHRGFLDIAVWRRAKDNRPWNARVMENHTTFAYFYCTKRPWNPYYDSPGVRVRLEAMLDFWCRSQGPDGRFSEYAAGRGNLAATGFGAMCMSLTLDLLHAGGPTIAPELLVRTMQAQRRAIMALLTDAGLRAHARQFSNQYSGVYRAATAYLRLRDDPEMRAALSASAAWAAGDIQSSAGWLYELNAPDFGYSRVHEGNMAVLRGVWDDVPDDVRRCILKETDHWAKWLSYNLLLDPGLAGYFVNAAVERRTDYAFQPFGIRPLATFVPAMRAFAMSNDEHAAAIAATRVALAKDWPRFRALAEENQPAYAPWMPFFALADMTRWFPTRAERDAAIAKLPYLAHDRFTTIAHEDRDVASSLTCTFVRRPKYYAIFNAGPNQPYDYEGMPNQSQSLGLGAVWCPALGTVLQTAAKSPWRWGTVLANATAVHETGPLDAPPLVNGRPVPLTAGWNEPPAGDVAFTYDLPGGGRKRITMGTDGIAVEVVADGSIAEQLPLVRTAATKTTADRTSYSIQHDRQWFTVSWNDPTKGAVRETGGVGTEKPSLHRLAHANGPAASPGFHAQRVMLVLTATDTLTYRLTFTPPSPPKQ